MSAPLTRAGQVMAVLEAGGAIRRLPRSHGPNLLVLLDAGGADIAAWQQAMAACMRHCTSTRADDGSAIYRLEPTS